MCQSRISDSIIENLKKMAYNSCMLQKHAAALIKSNKEICMGYNRLIRKHMSIHAEMDAIYDFIKKNRRYDLRGLDIIVIRFKNNELKISRPCKSCIEKMRELGIRKVYYSDYDGNIVYEYINDMEMYHMSSLQRMKIRDLF